MEGEARERAIMAALSDSRSGYYQGMLKVLRSCEAADIRAKAAKGEVTIPFQVEEADVEALAAQFSVSLRVRGTVMRAALAPRVAACVHLVDDVLMEHAAAGARRVLWVDGDLVTMVAQGVEGRLVERTNATSRLATGYFLEDEMVRRFRDYERSGLAATASVIARELEEAGGEHYWPRVRSGGPRVDVVVVNHFKTPAGPTQLAYLLRLRGGFLLGALPFQVDMLTKTEGELACFPGRFFVDKGADALTLVPAADASMTITIPYSAFLEVVLNNSVTVAGQEYLCEKYMNVKGIMYYSLRPVDSDFEAPEVLRTSYYDPEAARLSVLRYPRVKLSSSGVPVGWERGEVRMLTSRLERVLTRVMTSANEVVTPAEVFTALVDYNNSVVSSLDAVTLAERMSYEEEEAAALAIALHVNQRRHAMHGTFRVLLSAMKARHAVRAESVFGLAMLAVSAWWSRPGVVSGPVEAEIPAADVVDWCGRDFSVVMRDVDPWIEVEQVVGEMVQRPHKNLPGLPCPPGEEVLDWRGRLLERARAALRGGATVDVKRVSVGASSVGQSEGSGLTLVAEEPVERSVERPVLTALKLKLKAKMVAEQAAVSEVCFLERIEAYGDVAKDVLPCVPVVSVEPISALNADLHEVGGVPDGRDVVTTGYRLAEVDIEKHVECSVSINDSKRAIPAQRWVRRPRVDAGVEGKRVASQAALLGAMFKRNIGVPANRGVVDLNLLPDRVVDRVVDVCFRRDWQEVVQRHLETGMWEPNDEDIEVFLANADEKKTKAMLEEFFSEGEVCLDQWMLMAKGKVKPSRDVDTAGKIDHSQTIMYLESKSTNAMYSSMMRRFKRCVDECLRPEVSLNAQESSEEHEEWYNTLNARRRSFQRTYSYAADIKCFDRSQEHPALRAELQFYRRMGLDEQRLRLWEETHGVKRARAMMWGVVMSVVLGGVSGIWKTLFRNGFVALAGLVVATEMQRSDVVMIDIKGDDMDVETGNPLSVELAVERMSLEFNLSAKFFTNDVRYMCKEFRIKLGDRWYFVADPWARVQSLCTPMWIGNQEDSLLERWVSLRADLRHYDNGLLVDACAEAAGQYYSMPIVPYGMARALAVLASDRGAYFNFFHSPELVG